MSGPLKFGKALKEIRIHLCQTGKSSDGIRQFIQKNYVKIKSNNPDLPILIRECSSVTPKLWARFEKGKELCVSLADLKEDQIYKQFETVARKV